MKKYGIGLLSIAILIVSFLICRFALFDMHKMKQFPLVLLIAGGLFIGISMLFGCSRFPLFASLGYPVSFAAGLIFSQDYADPTGRNDPEQYVDNMHNSILGYRVHRHSR